MNHNNAYRLLMDQYIVEPSQEEIDLLKELFIDWCKSSKPTVLNHLIEVIETHESSVISDIAIDVLRDYYPKNKLKMVLDVWITNPVPSLRSFISEIIDINDFGKPVRTAAYLMLDEWEKALEFDPQFNHIDKYLKNLDPLLGSLLFERVSYIKSIETGYSNKEENELESTHLENLSIIDLIRRKEFGYLWDNILNYPFPFICELIKIFHENHWSPNDGSDIDIFEMLVELIGIKGWAGIEEIRWEMVSKQENKKFRPLNDKEIRDREFDLLIASDVKLRPDRVFDSNFVNRGSFNLTDANIDLFIYDEGIRKSDFDGLLHVPIFSRNGYELAEFRIPASSLNSFQMDEDGTYFTVRSKKELYSIDIDALATILLPVAKHSEMVTEMILSIKERAKKKSKMAMDGLDLISALHIGREFTLWDLKNETAWTDDSVEKPHPTCRCRISIDFGNTNTKICILPGQECGHEMKTWLEPSLVYYESPNQYQIGHEVIASNLTDSAQTFRNWMEGLQRGKRRFIRIHNAVIPASTTLEHFLFGLLEKISKEIEYKISSITFSYSLDMPSFFQPWLRQKLSELGFVDIDFIDQQTAAIIAMTKISNQRGNLLVIDIGSSQMSVAIAKADYPKSRKRKVEGKLLESPLGTPEIIAKLTVPLGSEEITNLLHNTLSKQGHIPEWSQINDIKHKLSFDFELSTTIDDAEQILTLNPVDTERQDKSLDLRTLFENSDLFKSFKLLIRNIIIKATYRGLERKKIQTILINGAGAEWPIFLEYLQETFNDKEIIMENNPFLTVIGAGLVSEGNPYEFFTEMDYTLKITNKGVVSYNTLISRGLKFTGKRKSYQVQPQARFDRIVIDWWVREPKFLLNDELPLKDNDRVEFRRDDDEFFNFERLHREIVEFSDDDEFEVSVNPDGKLNFGLQSAKDKKSFETNIRIY